MCARLVLVLVGLSSLMACGGNGDAPRCISQSDCPSGQACLAGTCLEREVILDGGLDDAGLLSDAGEARDGNTDTGLVDSGPTDSGTSPEDASFVDSSIDAGQPDTSIAPLRIAFPPRGSITSADHVVVRGISDVGQQFGSVNINGVPATSTDNFATFSAEIPLGLGTTDILVQADTRTYEVSAVRREDVVILAPRDMHRLGDSLYVVDSAYRRLVLIDVPTGTRSVLSSDSDGAGPIFEDPRGIVVTADAMTAYVVDTTLEAVFRVSLATGDRTILSNASVGRGPALGAPRRVILDDARGRLLLVDSSLDAVVAVALSDGTRTVISDDDLGMGPPMSSPRDLALDATRSRLLVTDSGASALFTIDLTTGDRDVLQGQGPFYAQPRGVVMSTDNATAYVTDSGIATLFAVNLETGDRTILADTTTSPGPWSDPRRVELGTNGTLLVLDYITDAIVSVNPTAGTQSTIAQSAAGTGPHLGGPWGLAVDESTSSAPVYVTDNFLEQVFEIDLVTGTRRVASELIHPGPNLDQPYGATWDSTRGGVYLVDAILDALIFVDVGTGERIAVSNDVTGTGPTFNAPRDAVVVGGTVYVVDSGADAVFAVDPVTGDRTLVSNDSRGSGPTFAAPWSIVASSGQNLVVADSDLAAIIDVDISTGDRTVRTEGMPSFSQPRGLTRDANGTLFVTDLNAYRVIAIDPMGMRTTIAGPGVGQGPPLSGPAGIKRHADGYLLVVDANDALFAVDIATGDLVLVSK